MENNSKAFEFLDCLSKIITKSVDKEVILFNEKYAFCLTEKWYPWAEFQKEFFEKCIVVSFLKDKNHLGTGSSGCSYKSSQEKCSSSEETGNPLECEFEISVFESTVHDSRKYTFCDVQKPMNLSEAMYIMELFDLYLCQKNAEDLSLVVLCDAKDIMKTLMIGKSKRERLHATQNDQITLKNQLMMISNEKNETKKQQHFKTETSLYNYYNILEGSHYPQSLSNLKPTISGLFALECIHLNMSKDLKKQYGNSSCVMLIQAVVGSEQTGASQKFKEFKLVESLFNCLHCGHIVWGNVTEAHSVVDSIQKFIQEIKSTGTVMRINQFERTSEPTDFDSMFVSYITAVREDMDLTDYLWSILQDCSSYQELTDALNLALSELQDFYFTPFISERNKTTLAELIRNIKSNPFSPLSVYSTIPMQYVLDIGIEKLQKDYIAIFARLQMIPLDLLMDIIKKSADLDYKLNCLKAFHCTLELLIIVWSYLRLPQLELSNFACSVLKAYVTNVTIETSHIFNIPISIPSVKNILDRIQPVFWQTFTKMFNDNDDYCKNYLVHLNKKQPYWVSSSTNSIQITTNPSYHSTSVVVISDLL